MKDICNIIYIMFKIYTISSSFFGPRRTSRKETLTWNAIFHEHLAMVSIVSP